jgi:hypothetical protein
VEDTRISPVMAKVVWKMRSQNLSLVGFRGRKGSLRYLLSNNEIVTKQTVQGMIERGLLEMIGEKEGRAFYRLKVE